MNLGSVPTMFWIVLLLINIGFVFQIPRLIVYFGASPQAIPNEAFARMHAPSPANIPNYDIHVIYGVFLPPHRDWSFVEGVLREQLGDLVRCGLAERAQQV